MNLASRTRVVGPCMLALASLLFAVTSLFVKMGSDTVPVSLIVLTRFVFMFAVFAALRATGRIRVQAHNKKLLFWRSTLASLGGVFYFYAMAAIPIAEAVVLKYTYPLFAVAIAIFIYRERTGRGVLGAMGLCLAGIVVMVNPLFSAVGLGHLWGLLNGIVAGFAIAILRQLRATDDSSTVLYYHSVAGVLISLPLLANGWTTPDLAGGIYTLLAAVFGLLAQFSMVYGFRYIKTGSGSVVMGLEVVFSALLALVFLGQVPGLWKIVGGTMILVGAALVSGREKIKGADIREGNR